MNSSKMRRGNFDSLISALGRLRPRKRQRRITCLICHGNNVELVNQIDDKEGSRKIEEYFCHDCNCEWDWTYQAPFFRWGAKISAPRWVKID